MGFFLNLRLCVSVDCELNKGQYKEFSEFKTILSLSYQNLAKEDKRRRKTKLLKVEPVKPQTTPIERITQQLSQKTWV